MCCAELQDESWCGAGASRTHPTPGLVSAISVARGVARLSRVGDVLLCSMKAILSHSGASLLCHQLWSQTQSPSIQNMALSKAQIVMTLSTTGWF